MYRQRSTIPVALAALDLPESALRATAFTATLATDALIPRAFRSASSTLSIVSSAASVRIHRGFPQPFHAAQRLLGLLVLVVFFMASTSPALAVLGSGTPSAADQYVEDVPTTTGAKPARDTGTDGTGGFSESGVMIWLLVALAATTVAGLGTAGYERRQHRRVGV